jgi:dolichyl-phosphate beta-glucosyltransferase
MIESTLKLLNSNNLFTSKSIEIIMINDGSKDSTWNTIKDLVEKYKSNLMVGLTYKKNGGKGFAVRSGMKQAKGDIILMVDADGATDVNEIPKFYSQMVNKLKNNKNDNTIIIGSRNFIDDDKEANRPLLRKLPSLVNNFFVRKLIGIKGIKDTQCGFKIFTQKGKNFIFSKMHLNRWAFDIELLYLAQK